MMYFPLPESCFVNIYVIIVSGGSRICEKGGPGIQMPETEKVAHGEGRGGRDFDTFSSSAFSFASFTLWGRGYRPPT